MNDRKKTLFALAVVNSICAAIWNIHLFADFVCGYTGAESLGLHIICALAFNICAVIWIFNYQNLKKKVEKQNRNKPLLPEDIQEEAKNVRPYDHVWGMYYDEFEDLSEEESLNL